MDNNGGKISRFISNTANFAKTKPSLFAVIVIAVIFGMLFITYEALHLTSTPTFCGTCHKEAPTGPGAEFYTWEKNVHAFAGIGCIDCHGAPGLIGYGKAKMGGLYDLYGEIFHSKEAKMEILTKGATDLEYAKKLVPNDWCLVCHSDADNERIRKDNIMSFLGVEMRLVDGVVNPEFRKSHGLPDIMTDEMPTISLSHENHVVSLGLSCLSCHQGVAHEGNFSNKTKMETCFTCHDQERAKNPDIAAPLNDDCASCHSLAVAQQDGTLLESKGVEKTIPSMMQDLGIYGECSSCHNTENPSVLPTREICGTACHGEETYVDIYDEIRADFDAKKKPLDELNIKFYQARNKMNAEQLASFHEFKYYYKIISNDASKGIHNDELANIVFAKADEIANKLAESLNISVQK